MNIIAFVVSYCPIHNPSALTHALRVYSPQRSLFALVFALRDKQFQFLYLVFWWNKLIKLWIRANLWHARYVYINK